MDDAAFLGVVVGYTVPLVCDFFATSVGGCCDCGFTAATADDLNVAMVDCYGITSDTIFQTCGKRIACETRCSLSASALKGRQRKLSQGKCSFPCAAQAANVGVWISHAPTKPSAERTTPDRVYKCALVNKGIILQSLPRLVFSKMLLLPRCVLRGKGTLSLPRPSWRSAPARCFPDSRHGRKDGAF